jgi:hypothetical protein
MRITSMTMALMTYLTHLQDMTLMMTQILMERRRRRNQKVMMMTGRQVCHLLIYTDKCFKS